MLRVSPAVRAAVQSHRSVVALESTVVSHGGLPHPRNLALARELERLVREHGAEPATVGVVDGALVVGLDGGELEAIAQPGAGVSKCSTRDLPVVLQASSGGRRRGSTTVAATMWAAHLAGVEVFATGGLGGVHRGADWDVSADLLELQRTPVTVVCAGVKSILDVPATLEYLETASVPVGVLSSSSLRFPRFFSQGSDEVQAQFKCSSPDEVAAIMRTMRELRMTCGMVLAVPPPPEATDEDMEGVIQDALRTAEEQGVRGKAVTPFVLAQVARLTHGRSIEKNIALLRNNVIVAAKVAVAYSRNGAQKRYLHSHPHSRHVVVVGGAAMDVEARAAMVGGTPRVRTTTTRPGTVTLRHGGVGRNLAVACAQFAPTILVCALGQDAFGRDIHTALSRVPNLNLDYVTTVPARTPCVVQMIDAHNGEFLGGVADFDGAAEVRDLPPVEVFSHTCTVLVDGNVSMDVAKRVLDLALAGGVPVVGFEPTSASKAAKLGPTLLKHPALTLLTPNREELGSLVQALLGRRRVVCVDANALLAQAILHLIGRGDENAAQLAAEVAHVASVWRSPPPATSRTKHLLVSMGAKGVLAVELRGNDGFDVVLDTTPCSSPIVSVSGAGDTQCAVFAHHISTHSQSLPVALRRARQGAMLSLSTAEAVPDTLALAHAA